MSAFPREIRFLASFGLPSDADPLLVAHCRTEEQLEAFMRFVDRLEELGCMVDTWEERE